MAEKRCEICGSTEAFHVHDGEIKIPDYFTVGRGMTDFQAAQAWKVRALTAEKALAAAREADDPADRAERVS